MTGPARARAPGRREHRSRRTDVSMAGLCREAIDRALADAGTDWPQIDAVVLGKAPDLFEGVMMPELFLADAIGATGKPLLRVHTAGSVGGVDRDRGQQPRAGRRAPPGAGGRVREAVGVQRDVGAVDQSAVHDAGRRRRRRVLRAAHPLLHPPLRRAAAHRRAGRGQGPAQRRLQPVRAPAPAGHHAGVGAAPRRCCGTRSATTRPARPRTAPARWSSATRPRPRRATGRWPGSGPRRCAPSRPRSPARTTSTRGPGGRPPRRCGARPASPTRWTQIDVAEIYVPFSWFEPMWLENLGLRGAGAGLEAHRGRRDRAIGGRLPVNPSGGVLCSNPIGASGLLRFAEAAMQVMGRAGEHQVAGARTALGHAYGGGSQFFAMWVVGTTPPA